MVPVFLPLVAVLFLVAVACFCALCGGKGVGLRAELGIVRSTWPGRGSAVGRVWRVNAKRVATRMLRMPYRLTWLQESVGMTRGEGESEKCGRCWRSWRCWLGCGSVVGQARRVSAKRMATRMLRMPYGMAGRIQVCMRRDLFAFGFSAC